MFVMTTVCLQPASLHISHTQAQASALSHIQSTKNAAAPENGGCFNQCGGVMG